MAFIQGDNFASVKVENCKWFESRFSMAFKSNMPHMTVCVSQVLFREINYDLCELFFYSNIVNK